MRRCSSPSSLVSTGRLSHSGPRWPKRPWLALGRRWGGTTHRDQSSALGRTRTGTGGQDTAGRDACRCTAKCADDTEWVWRSSVDDGRDGRRTLDFFLRHFSQAWMTRIRRWYSIASSLCLNRPVVRSIEPVEDWTGPEGCLEQRMCCLISLLSPSDAREVDD